MNIGMKISFVTAALVAVGTIGFALANGDTRNESTSLEPEMLVTAVLASPETPQHLVWDMTYGPERTTPVEEAIVQLEAPIVDYTFG